MLKIITDSSSNISQSEAKAMGITVIPLTISFGNEEYRDGIDMTCDRFYEKLANCGELPHTSQLSEADIENAVNGAAAQGDEVLIIPISSALSGSYERCVNVAKRKKGVYVFDSKCTTVMLKILVLSALENADKTAAEVIEILQNMRKRIKLVAALDTLEYLEKGGRLSKTSALLGAVLKIKPVITINLEGKVEVVSKQIGMNKAIGYMASRIEKSKIDKTKPAFLLYTMNDCNAETFAKKFGAQYSEKCNICPVIGAHIGPDALGFAYVEKI